MPLLDSIPTEPVKHLFLPFGPPHVRGLRILPYTDHLIWNRQLRIDTARERMDQLRPRGIPQPKHRAAVGAEGAERRTLFIGRVLLGLVFSAKEVS